MKLFFNVAPLRRQLHIALVNGVDKSSEMISLILVGHEHSLVVGKHAWSFGHKDANFTFDGFGSMKLVVQGLGGQFHVLS